MTYIKRCVEEEDSDQSPTTCSSQGQKAATIHPATVEETELWVDEGRWVEEDRRDQEITQQSQRLDRLEAALQQILQVLTPSTPNLESNTQDPAGYSLPEEK